MKLSKWAKQNGLTYRTAYNLFKAGKLPVPAEQLATGTILITEPAIPTDRETAIYARVSSAEQRPDLEAQIGRLTVYANMRGLAVHHTIHEIGSGLNGHRPKLLKLLGNARITTIIVERRDRLVRFGFEYLEATLRAQGRQLLVMDTTEMDNDLVRDMIEVLTSFCARLYGKRSARKRAERALKAIKE